MRILCLLGAILLASCSAPPTSGYLNRIVHPPNNWVVSEEGDTLKIHIAHGGSLFHALELGSQVRIHRLKVEFLGLCESSCPIFAEMVEDVSCVGPQASFGYHKGQNPNGIYEDMSGYFRENLVEWVDNNGGWPEGTPPTYLRGTELDKFFRSCEDGSRN